MSPIPYGVLLRLCPCNVKITDLILMRPTIHYSLSDASIHTGVDVGRLSPKVCKPPLRHGGAEDGGRVREKGNDLAFYLCAD